MLGTMKCLFYLLCISLILFPGCIDSVNMNSFDQSARLTYTPAMLKSINVPCIVNNCHHNEYNIPELKRRKRGKKGGVKHKLRRRKSRPYIPSIVFGNVRSLRNKMDELQGNARWCWEYREASALVFTETWFNDNNTVTDTSINGFNIFRGDRVATAEKSRGGGVCLYINNEWAHVNNVTVTGSMCVPDIEVLTVNIRPFYLPREITNVVINAVYIPPQAKTETVKDTLVNLIHEQETRWPDAFKLVIGDFNHVTLANSLPNYHQYVTCKTRGNKTIDLCYGNFENAYKSIPLPSLGDSDHDMIHLRPKYRPVLKRRKPTVKTIQRWTEDTKEELKGCFACTDWDIFKEQSNSIDELTDTVNAYISFCVNIVVPKQTVKIFPNNKPWVTKELKDLIMQKGKTKVNDKEELSKLGRCIKNKVKECKEKYKNKIEDNFKINDMAGVWRGLKQATGLDSNSTNVHVTNVKEYVNDLNKFYARFDTLDFSKEHSDIRMNLSNEMCDNVDVHFDTQMVRKELSLVNTKKAGGPDGVGSTILKTCASELADIFSYLFNMSFSQHSIPYVWKTSEIIPVPKKKKVEQMNDLRPVALTSVVFKCFEKLVLRQLLEQVKDQLDIFQFAYKANRNVEDALLVYLNNVYNHLDFSKTYVRSLFIDFSSAFNTIQPHQIVNKLQALHVSNDTVLWLFEFLTNRLQFVKMNSVNSDLILTNTGAPQGCVLSPVLYTIYTNDFKCLSTNTQLIKFADDSTILGLMSNNEEHFFHEVNRFSSWCKENYLSLNAKKTKEIVFDFRKSVKTNMKLVEIDGEVVESVEEYKYLGITIDCKLTWHAHFNVIYKKANQRMYFLRKLKSFKLRKEILQVFYMACIQSILTFGLVCWGGNISESDKTKLNKLIRKASKILEEKLFTIEELYNIKCKDKGIKVLEDLTHPLYKEFVRSERSGRLLSKTCRTERYKRSFVPSATKLLQ